MKWQFGLLIEHKTCEISAAERLGLMRFDNQFFICISPKICMYTEMITFHKENKIKRRNMNPLLGKSIIRNVRINLFWK